MKKILIISELKNGELPKEIQLAISLLNQCSFDFYLLGSIPEQINLVTSSIGKLVSLENDLNFNLGVDIQNTDYQYIITNSGLKINQLIANLSNRFSMPIFGNVIGFQWTGDEIKEINQLIFSGKAKQKYSPTSHQFILSLSKLFEGNEIGKNDMLNPNFEKGQIKSHSNEKLNSINLVSEGINLEDARLVVGAGRGMKAKENWGIIEDLAKKLGAATACSKPVSDLDWRPHHEHVGQTGVKIAPELYIACGISGAIQHLAGVNGSKTIVVINNDPEAPFVKNADYIIQGDLFKVLPKLLNKLN